MGDLKKRIIITEIAIGLAKKETRSSEKPIKITQKQIKMAKMRTFFFVVDLVKWYLRPLRFDVHGMH